MNKYLSFLYFSIGCIFLYSCAISSNTILSNNKNMYLVNFDTINNKENTIPLSTIFDSVRVVILDNKEVLIGDINRIQSHQNKIFVLDSYVAKGVFEFDQEGNYIRKIGNIGSGPGEYASCSDFIINERLGEIYIYDSRYGCINRYDLQTGIYKSSLKIEEADRVDHIWVNSGRLYTIDCGISYKPSDSFSILKEVDLNSGEIIGEWMNNNQYNKGWRNCFSGFSFVPIDDNRDLFTYGLGDSIMCLNNGKLFPYMALSGKKLIDRNEFSSEDLILPAKATLRAKKENDFFMRWMRQDRIMKISSIFRYKKAIYMECFGKKTYTIKYDTDNNQISMIDFDDDVQFSRYPDSRIVPSFLTADKQGVYYFLRTDNIWELKQFAMEGLISDRVINKEKLKKLDDDSNPVILYYKFKK